MWYLLEDFFDQSLVMKALLGWGWLCVIIMVASLADKWLPIAFAAITGDGSAAAAAPAAH